MNDKYPEKCTFLLMTAGDDNENTFNKAQSYYHIISNILGGKDLGMYCAGGCTGCEKTVRSIDPIHLDNAYQLGRKL